MARPEIVAAAGAELKRLRVRLGLTSRFVEERSLELAREHSIPEYAFSKAWITDVERGRFMPGTFKLACLSRIYDVDLAELQKLYGIAPGDIAKERFFLPAKTHLFSLADEMASAAASLKELPAIKIEKTNLLTELVNIWGDVPVPLLRRLDLRSSLYGYIGTEDATMSPLLPPGTFVQIDAKQTRIEKGPFPKTSGQSIYARPIYFLDIRTGYLCGWCEVRDGVLTFVPHPESGEQTRTFRYPSEVSVVGRVTGIAMRIEDGGVEVKSIALRKKRPKK